MKLTGCAGRFVLLFSDGGYAEKSWKEMIPSGIAADRAQNSKGAMRAYARKEIKRRSDLLPIANSVFNQRAKKLHRQDCLLLF